MKIYLSLTVYIKKTKDLDYLSDKGLILILQKKYAEALKLYQFIDWDLKSDRSELVLFLTESFGVIEKQSKEWAWEKQFLPSI